MQRPAVPACHLEAADTSAPCGRAHGIAITICDLQPTTSRGCPTLSSGMVSLPSVPATCICFALAATASQGTQAKGAGKVRCSGGMRTCRMGRASRWVPQHLAPSCEQPDNQSSNCRPDLLPDPHRPPWRGASAAAWQEPRQVPLARPVHGRLLRQQRLQACEAACLACQHLGA